MAAYFFMAIVCSALSYLAARCEQRLRPVALAAYVVVILLFCHFAGARDIRVGTDTAGYGYQSYLVASNSSLDYFFFSSQYSSWAPLYKVVIWFTCDRLGSMYWCLAVIQLLTIVPTLLACRSATKDYLPLAVFCYALLFYPMSFNMMRQMIAMAFVLFSYRYVEDRRAVPFACTIAIAVGFHASAVLGAVVYPLARMARPKTFSGGVKLAALAIGSMAAMAFAPKVLNLAGSLGFYDAYVTGSAVVSGGGRRTLVTTCFSVLVLGAVSALFLKNDPKDAEDCYVPLAAIVIFGAVCLSLSLISLWLYRIGFYYLYFSLLLVPRLCSAIDDRWSRLAFVLIVILAVSLWSIDYYAIQDSHEVVPYILTSTTL